jgi:hypothetical protein
VNPEIAPTETTKFFAEWAEPVCNARNDRANAMARVDAIAGDPAKGLLVEHSRGSRPGRRDEPARYNMDRQSCLEFGCADMAQKYRR